MAVSFKIDEEALNSIERTIGRRKTAVAFQAAISRTITTGVALIARRIGEEVNLKISDIKKTITAKRGSFDKPSGSIDLDKGKAVWLAQFLTTAQKRGKLVSLGGGKFKQSQALGGVKVKVRKKPTSKYPVSENLPHAFVESMPRTSYIGVFQRTGIKRAMKSGRYKGKIKEVIRRMRGPAPISVFLHARGENGSDTIVEEVQARLATEFQKNFASQVERMVNPRSSDPQQRLIESAGKALGI